VSASRGEVLHTQLCRIRQGVKFGPPAVDRALRQTAETMIPLLLVGLVCVQPCGDGDPAYPIVGCHYLKGVALLADGIAFAIEVFQQEPAYPNTRYLNVGEDVAGAHHVNVVRAVEGLPLGKEVSGLLRFSDGETSRGGNGQGRIVVNVR
jgi:hypothetical protein